MATVEVGPETVTIRMSALDTVVSFRRQVELRRASIVAARAVPNARKAIDADIRLFGTAIPGLVVAGELGSVRGGGGTTFAVTYRGRPGLALDLDDRVWQHVVLTLPDADRVVRALGW